MRFLVGLLPNLALLASCRAADEPPACEPVAELCNGVDDDCNGLLDDNPTDAAVFYRDLDADTFGDAASSTSACAAPGGYVDDATDCDDGSAEAHPGAVEADCADPTDLNCDGSSGFSDADDDGFAACQDCDDKVATINADAEEQCDGVDNDCDAATDESGAGAGLWYADADGDGFGDGEAATKACDGPDDYVGNNDDCNDTNADAHPGAAESCNGIDDDCDGASDEAGALDQTSWYVDWDGDGHGSTQIVLEACARPTGFVAADDDCDDSNDAAFPGAVEVCDGVDGDCDAVIDDGFDKDADGFTSCDGDCNDVRDDVNPLADEVCNARDDDCDGDTDGDDALDATIWYVDVDGDGAGTTRLSITACTVPSGFSSNDDDCNDGDAAASPTAPEVCDAQDDDCDGTVDDGFDKDADGFTSCAGDCADARADTNPDADEACNGRDDDCDGQTDEAGATGGTPWYGDGDGDGHGSATRTVVACAAPAGYVSGSGDCDDLRATVAPNATEICDGLDNDCDAAKDEGFDVDGDKYTSCGGDCSDSNNKAYPGATETCDTADNDCDGATDESGGTTWYLDFDGDAYSASKFALVACTQPSGYTTKVGDCDDTDPTYSPGAKLACDGGDRNCDGDVDNDLDGDGYATTTCGGDDCDDTNAAVLPEVGGGCALGSGCGDLVADGTATTNGLYTIDPDGFGTGVAPIDVWCDVAAGGWTLVAQVTNRWAPASAPGPFHTQRLVQSATGWTVDASAPPLTPTRYGTLRVDNWPKPTEIRYRNVQVSNGTVKNQVVFDDSASVDHLTQFTTQRHLRTGSAVGFSTPFNADRTFYFASDHLGPWYYWGGIMGRERQPGITGWQLGLSVNRADNIGAYNGVNDDSGRGEYNLGVGAKSNGDATDITGYWVGGCISNCNEDWATSLPANHAATQVWYR